MAAASSWGARIFCRSASRPARSATTCRRATCGSRPITPCIRDLDGVLIEAKDLINGVSIVQAEAVESVEYFHIELDSHDVIIAEGALSESFIDDDSRGMFHNAHDYDTLYAEEFAHRRTTARRGSMKATRSKRCGAPRAARRPPALRRRATARRAARLRRPRPRDQHRRLGAEHRCPRSAGLSRHFRRRQADRAGAGECLSRRS